VHGAAGGLHPSSIIAFTSAYNNVLFARPESLALRDVVAVAVAGRLRVKIDAFVRVAGGCSSSTIYRGRVSRWVSEVVDDRAKSDRFLSDRSRPRICRSPLHQSRLTQAQISSMLRHQRVSCNRLRRQLSAGHNNCLPMGLQRLAIIASPHSRLSQGGKSTASLCLKRKEGEAGIEGLTWMTELCIISDATRFWLALRPRSEDSSLHRWLHAQTDRAVTMAKRCDRYHWPGLECSCCTDVTVYIATAAPSSGTDTSN
jgi:hypothetical protein